MAESKWNLLFSAYIRNPVSGEDTFYSNNYIRSVRFDSFEKGFLISFHVTVKNNFSIRTDDTEIHYPGVKVDAAVILVCGSIEPHWVSSLLGKKVSTSSIPIRHAEGEASMSITDHDWCIT